MNPILNRFPRSVMVRGISVPIRWDFRTCAMLTLINEDPELAWMERISLMLDWFYPEAVPDDTNEAVRMMSKFLNCGQEALEIEHNGEIYGIDDESSDDMNSRRMFSFEKDGELIYTAFIRTYGIDLEQETVHWWKFLALLKDLHPDCLFTRIVHLRRAYLEGTLTPDEQALFAGLGEVALPPDEKISPEEQAAIEQFLMELGEEV